MTSLLPPRYHFKISKRNPLQRLAWLVIRHYLNTDRYAVKKIPTGPRRHSGQVTTYAADATGWRIYLEERRSVLTAERRMLAGQTLEFEQRRARREQTRKNIALSEMTARIKTRPALHS